MSSILKDKYIFYSYWDKDGHGINPEHLVTYSASPIFDHYNRTIYAYGGIFGPHYFGSYHGEIFNDYERNVAQGDYSSASGHRVVSYNEGEAGFGKYNISREGQTIFTVGNGNDEEHHNAFEIWGDGSTYIPGTLYAGRVNAYAAHYNELDIDVTYIDDLHVEQTAYIHNAYVESSYNEYTYSAYADIDELHVNTSYTDVAYFGENAYAGNNLWVKRLGDDISYTNAAYAFSRMVRMFPLLDPTPEGFVNGKYYIWVGKTIDLPPVEERYANVIYIVLDDAPSSDLPIFDDDTNE